MDIDTPSDDPRISAYVLNEMSRDEREAFEAQMAFDADLRREVEAMAEAVRLAGAAAAGPARPRLESHRRRAIEAAVTRGVSPSRPRMFRLVAAACVALFAGILAAYVIQSKPGSTSARVRARSTAVLIAQLGAALKQYQHDFSSLPPDTGFGLSPVNSDCGAGRTYDSGSLWRYLALPVEHNGKTFGPYMQFDPHELVSYADPCYGPSYYVVDTWGTQLGYIGNPQRVIHNRGGFDLFSAGPDRRTAQDIIKNLRANMAYDGIDNDGDGIVDNSNELGVAALNGSLTVANASLGLPADALDDINNWDQRD